MTLGKYYVKVDDGTYAEGHAVNERLTWPGGFLCFDDEDPPEIIVYADGDHAFSWDNDETPTPQQWLLAGRAARQQLKEWGFEFDLVFVGSSGLRWDFRREQGSDSAVMTEAYSFVLAGLSAIPAELVMDVERHKEARHD